jgi:hypothetical protein
MQQVYSNWLDFKPYPLTLRTMYPSVFSRTFYRDHKLDFEAAPEVASSFC